MVEPVRPFGGNETAQSRHTDLVWSDKAKREANEFGQRGNVVSLGPEIFEKGLKNTQERLGTFAMVPRLTPYRGTAASPRGQAVRRGRGGAPRDGDL